MEKADGKAVTNGAYDYKILLERVLIQQGVVQVTGEKYDFTPEVAAGNTVTQAEASFTLTVNTATAEVTITKPIKVTESPTKVLAELKNVGVLSDDAVVGDIVTKVETALTKEKVEVKPPQAAVTLPVTLTPAKDLLKAKLEGTWKLDAPAKFVKFTGPNAGNVIHAYRVPAGGMQFEISNGSYTGTQIVDIYVYNYATYSGSLANWQAGTATPSPGNELSVISAPQSPPYVENGTVSYEVSNGHNYVTISGRTPTNDEIDLTGNASVKIEVEFDGSNAIELLGDDAEELHMTGNTWVRQ
jgi:hypothetical protein